MFPAEFQHIGRNRQFTVQMDRQQRLGLLCDVLFDESFIYLQGVHPCINEHRYESHACDGKDRGIVSVGRHENLVALLQSAQFHFAH